MPEHSIVVRCALQSFADHKVICPDDWTVLKLKQYITDFSDQKPDSYRQRLIYGGKCLDDDSTLASVLRPLSDGQVNHVIHLVYTPTVQQLKQQKIEEKNDLRRRNVPSPSPVAPTPAVPQNASPVMNQFENLPNLQPFFNNSQMMLAQQQMYQAYMANYMNYMQQMYGAMYGQMGASTAAMAMNTTPILPNAAPAHNAHNNVVNNQNAPHNAPVPAAPPQAQPNNNDQPMVMNAQGGLVDADLDQPGGGDWLDWFYSASRVGILAMILYFYSSFERFLLVTICVSLMYAIHNGWFALRNRRFDVVVNNDNNNNMDAGNGQNEAADEQNNPIPAEGEEGQGPEEQSDENQELSMDEAEGVDEPSPLTPSNWNVFWSVCYTFITSFFTSLIPERPPPVNIN